MNCSDVFLQPPPLQCTYTLDHCHSPYLTLHYCHLPSLVPHATILILLFSALGTTASDYLCPNLYTVSKMLHLSDDLAGLTLLALGNSAPDVLSTYTAMGVGAGSLALSELMGAALFITTVVVGLMAMVHPFKVPKGPFVRDGVFFLGLTVLVVASLADSRLSFANSLAMIGLYVAYVVYVGLAHSFRQARLAAQARARIVQSNYDDISLHDMEPDYGMGYLAELRKHSRWEKVKEAMNDKRINSEGGLSCDLVDLGPAHSRSQYSDDPRGVYSSYSDDPEERARSNMNAQESENDQEDGDISENQVDGGEIGNADISENQVDGGEIGNADISENQVLDGREIENADISVNAQVLDNRVENAGVSVNHNAHASAIYRFLKLLAPQLIGLRDESLLSRLHAVVSFPAALLLRVSSPVRDYTLIEALASNDVPQFDFDQDRSLLAVQTVVGLNFVSYQVFSGMKHYWLVGGPVFLLSLLAAWTVLRFYTFREGHESPVSRKRLQLLNHVYCVFGFAVSVAWIAVFAEEVIEILQAAAIILRLREDVLGVTVFAVGNSIGDLISNYTIASMGMPLMAFGACFGGPLMSLCSMGVSALIVAPQGYVFEKTTTIDVVSLALVWNVGVMLVLVRYNGWVMDGRVGGVLMVNWVGAILLCAAAN